MQLFSGNVRWSFPCNYKAKHTLFICQLAVGVQTVPAEPVACPRVWFPSFSTTSVFTLHVFPLTGGPSCATLCFDSFLAEDTFSPQISDSGQNSTSSMGSDDRVWQGLNIHLNALPTKKWKRKENFIEWNMGLIEWYERSKQTKKYKMWWLKVNSLKSSKLHSVCVRARVHMFGEYRKSCSAASWSKKSCICRSTVSSHNYTKSAASACHLCFILSSVLQLGQTLTMTPTVPGAKRANIISLTFVLMPIKSGNLSGISVRRFKFDGMNF